MGRLIGPLICPEMLALKGVHVGQTFQAVEGNIREAVALYTETSS